MTAKSAAPNVAASSAAAQDVAARSLARAVWMLSAIWVTVEIHRQIMPALLGASPILRDFGITADSAGLLAAVYFPAYGLMQVPAGIIADRGVPRRYFVGACLFLGCAGLLFALGPTLEWTVVGRALVGLASGLFWVPSLKLFLDLSPRYYGRSIGLILALGSIGAVAALALLPVLLQQLPWRSVALLAALSSFPLAALALLLPQAPPTARPARSSEPPWIKIWAVLRDVRFWRLIWPDMMWVGTWFGVLTWLPRYARDVLGVPLEATGLLAAATTVAFIVGSYLFGWAASRYPRSTRPAFFLTQVASLAVILVLPFLGTQPSQVALYAVMVAFGLLFGAFFLYMPLFALDLPVERVGTATGLGNGLGYLTGFIVPWLMGWALDLVDRPTVADAVYSAAAYNLAWFIAAGCVAVGLLGAALLTRWPSRNG